MAAVRYSRYKQKQVDRFPQLYELTESTIIGSFSWLGLSSKTRMLFAPCLIPFAGYLLTPSDAARDYLTIKYPDKLRATKGQLDAVRIHRSHPLFAVPGVIEDAVYIDLRAAFWNILRVIGWDVEYFPNRWLAVRSDVSDFPFPNNKLARNCLVTSGLLNPQKIWSHDDQRLKLVRKGNKLCNLVLWAAVQDVLHGVASDAIGAGARYVHTDGYICSSRDAADVLTAIAGWGLPSGIKRSGRAVIYGPGTYDIGSHKAKRPTPAKGFINKVNCGADISWLRRRFRSFADRIDLS